MLAGSLVIGIAGCGSSSQPKSAAAPSAGTSANSGGAEMTVGPVHAAFSAPNHAPVIGKPWPYSVHVADAAGHPLSGSVKIQFTFGGAVVGTDTPPVHPVKNGTWHDNLTFPKAALGQPITLQAVVHTSAGSVTLNWPVKARQ
jgi:hypothetical protein